MEDTCEHQSQVPSRLSLTQNTTIDHSKIHLLKFQCVDQGNLLVTLQQTKDTGSPHQPPHIMASNDSQAK